MGPPREGPASLTLRVSPSERRSHSHPSLAQPGPRLTFSPFSPGTPGFPCWRRTSEHQCRAEGLVEAKRGPKTEPSTLGRPW